MTFTRINNYLVDRQPEVLKQFGKSLVEGADVERNRTIVDAADVVIALWDGVTTSSCTESNNNHNDIYREGLPLVMY